MPCVRYRRFLSRIAAGESGPRGFEEHLARCPGCTRELSSLQSALRLVDEYLGEQARVRPPPALATRIVQALDTKAASRMPGNRWRWAVAGSAVAVALAIALSLPGANPHTRTEAPARGTSLPEQRAPGQPRASTPAEPEAALPSMSPAPLVRAPSATAGSSFPEVVVLDGQLEALARLAGDPANPWPDPVEGSLVQIEALSVEPLEIEPMVIPAL